MRQFYAQGRKFFGRSLRLETGRAPAFSPMADSREIRRLDQKPSSRRGRLTKRRAGTVNIS
jgi:hypothetical protein